MPYLRFPFNTKSDSSQTIYREMEEINYLTTNNLHNDRYYNNYYDNPIKIENKFDYSLLTKDELQQVKKAISLCITQLDYIGSGVTEIKKFQELRKKIDCLLSV